MGYNCPAADHTPPEPTCSWPAGRPLAGVTVPVSLLQVLATRPQARLCLVSNTHSPRPGSGRPAQGLHAASPVSAGYCHRDSGAAEQGQPSEGLTLRLLHVPLPEAASVTVILGFAPHTSGQSLKHWILGQQQTNAGG